MRRFFLGMVSVVALGACGGSPAMRAAERGDMNALRAEIGAREKAGDLSNGEAAKVALVVAERELRAAKGEEAAKRVRETRACTGELDGALSDRMKTHDLAGAEAAMALLDDGMLSASRARSWIGDTDDPWRAVGARTLSREEDRAARQKAMLDPSPRVRRAAMRAAADAKDPADFDALLEAARLDPEPIVRTEALRAAERQEERAKLLDARLRDLWQGADDAIREDIAVAWALPKVYVAGGRDALAVLIAGGLGPGAIAGAGAILRAPYEDKELRAVAAALLARTIDNATRRDRLHAIAVSPIANAALLEAIRKASKEDEVDKHVRVAALSRLLESPLTRDRGAGAPPEQIALENMAAQKDDPELASRARLALAHAGDLRVQAWLEQDLASSEPHARLAAADALAALGRSARGAPLLADNDASVRTRAACVMIAAARVTPR